MSPSHQSCCCIVLPCGFNIWSGHIAARKRSSPCDFEIALFQSVTKYVQHPLKGWKKVNSFKKYNFMCGEITRILMSEFKYDWILSKKKLTRKLPGKKLTKQASEFFSKISINQKLYFKFSWSFASKPYFKIYLSVPNPSW